MKRHSPLRALAIGLVLVMVFFPDIRAEVLMFAAKAALFLIGATLAGVVLLGRRRR